MFIFANKTVKSVPWNKDKLTGQKPPLLPKHVWAIRTKLHLDGRIRDLALFNLAIDSKLRGCDLVRLRVGDIAPHAGLIGLYQGQDLLAFPSVWHEPFGMPLVEAMACGLPVVATRGGGVPEVIKDGETGILLERGDAAALAQGIIRLLGDDALRARMGQAGRRRAVERFSWETVAENLLACYERVLGATP